MPTFPWYPRSSLFNHFHSKPTRPYFIYLTCCNGHTIAPCSNPKNPPIINYLTDSLGFAKPRARVIYNRFSSTKGTEEPHSVVQFLKSLGFSETNIRASANTSPQILFSDIDKNLKPKIQFFQELGLTGTDLVKFISKNPIFLTNIFEERLMPCIEVIKKFVKNDLRNEYLIQTLRRCNWGALKHPELRVSANISYLQSCGIVGAQLNVIMSRQPRILIMRNSDLKNLVSRVIDMGVSIDSRMLVHGLYTISCISSRTLQRKFKMFLGSGFSKLECLEMFRRAPGLLRTSEAKLKLGINFFTGTLKIDKAVLVRRPTTLMYSIEERVIPRYRVVQILKSKKLLKKEPKYMNVVTLSEEEFLDKFISKFRDDAEELLLAYKLGNLSHSEE